MKRILSLVLALALAVSLTACGATREETLESTAAPVTETAQPSVEAAGEAVSYPLTVVDQAGREVTIESEPQTIVSGYYISTSLVLALGQGDKLVGVEAKADTRDIYRLSAPEIMELPSVGTAKEFDLEGCAALDPDLVILPLKLAEAADSLAELGIPAILVNPESQDLLGEARNLMAQCLNCTDAAQALADFTAGQESNLSAALEGAETPTVYLAGNSSLLSTAGGAMYQSDLITMAGGQNVAQDLEDSYWVEVSYEQLLAWDPQVILLASDAQYTVEDVLADENLADCTAVKNGAVYQMPNKAEAWDSPVPGGILGAVWLAGQLHPDLVPAQQVEETIEAFYQTFYGFSYAQA